ncbi:MAG: hypothetical protein IPK07_17060 [Deltaproteobacteria bacterium]|nr:hypothetical protein [Deltaproteobacteria bacterium]
MIRRKRSLLLGALLCAATAAGSIAAEPATAPVVVQPTVDTEVIRFAITAERRKVFERGMSLTESEKEAFWDLYAGFEKERNALDKRMMRVLQDFVGRNVALDDRESLALTREAIALERDGEALRTSHFERIAAAVSGRVGARFYQLDDLITSAFKVGMLGQLPLIGNAPAPRPDR